MIKFEKFLKSATIKDCSEDFTSIFLNKDEIYMVLTDGCSSSLGDVILGSRFFHRAFENFVKNAKGHIYLDDINIYKNIAKKGKEIADLKWDDFLFTIFIIAINEKDDYISVFRMGDGGFSFKNKDGKIYNFSYEYENNAPFYLGYFLNKDFESGLFSESNFKCLASEPEDEPNFLISITDDKFQVREELWNYHDFSLQQMEKFICFSDGIDQIENLSRSEFLDRFFEEEQNSSYDPSFYKRKMNFLLKNKELKDDFSFVMFEGL